MMRKIILALVFLPLFCGYVLAQDADIAKQYRWFIQLFDKNATYSQVDWNSYVQKNTALQKVTEKYQLNNIDEKKITTLEEVTDTEFCLLLRYAADVRKNKAFPVVKYEEKQYVVIEPTSEYEYAGIFKVYETPVAWFIILEHREDDTPQWNRQEQKFYHIPFTAGAVGKEVLIGEIRRGRGRIAVSVYSASDALLSWQDPFAQQLEEENAIEFR